VANLGSREFLAGIFVGLAMNAFAGAIALLPSPSNGIVLLLIAFSSIALGMAALTARGRFDLGNRLSIALIGAMAVAAAAGASVIVQNPELIQSWCPVCSSAQISAAAAAMLVTSLGLALVFFLWILIARAWPGN
jgi:hypothetical protein